jgi:hypothetical protein
LRGAGGKPTASRRPQPSEYCRSTCRRWSDKRSR